MAIINILVEGDLDEAVAVKLIGRTNHIPGVCYGKRGCGYIKDRINGFNLAAGSLHCFALVDLMDTGLPCPSIVVQQWLPRRDPRMIFRVIVRELESWLIADPENLAQFLSIDQTLIRSNPEHLHDPKRELVNLARHSRSKKIRSALVPEPNSTAQVGKLYNSEMKRFIHSHWDIELARKNASSLDRCLTALQLITSS